MKFPTKNGIATTRGDQVNARECCLNSHGKAKSRDINVILVDIDMDDTFE